MTERLNSVAHIRFKEFSDFIKTENTIIKDPKVFQISYTPAEITQRGETYQIYSEISSFINYHVPNNILVVGLPGTGKTVTLVHIINKLHELGKDIDTFHVNCVDKNPNQVFMFLTDSGTKKLSTDSLVRRFLSSLKKDCLMVLDEIDKGSNMSELLYVLSRPKEIVKSFEHNINIVLVSNDLNWDESIDSSVRSSLQLKTIFFKPYRASELKMILKKRAKLGFLTKEAIHDNTLSLIAEKTAKRREGDCRVALSTLFYAAKRAERHNRNISDNDINPVFSKVVADIEKTRVTKLSSIQLFTLLSCIENEGESIDSIYESYKKLISQKNMPSLSRSMIFYNLKYLELQRLIRKKVKIIKTPEGRPSRNIEFDILIDENVVYREVEKRLLKLMKK